MGEGADMAEHSGEGTASLEKALDVLDAIGASQHGLGHAELAARLGVPRTTVYRILATLVARGMVRRDPFRRVYSLGLHCFELARKAFSMPDLVAAASLELRALRDLTGETSYLAALDGLETVSLDRFEGAHSERSAAVHGERKPVYSTSQGKAILSALDRADRDAIIRDLVLRPFTPKTITDRRRLRAELKLTTARGYAIDDEETLPGVHCVGAPIVDPEGKVRGAISIAGPAYRLTLERLNQLGSEIAGAARRIGAQLRTTDARASEEPSTAIDGPSALHGALPRWSADDASLYWADTLAPAVRKFDGAQDRLLATIDAPITALVLHRDGVLVAHEGGWLVVDRRGSIHPLAAWPGVALLALGARAKGELWASMRSAQGNGCDIGILGLDGNFVTHWHVTEGVEAIAWDQAGESLYAAAPASGSILLMQPGSHSVRRLATVPKGSGRPSGLALDVKGGVWTALRDGWSVARFAPDGDLDRIIGLPVPCPTDLAFGGSGLGTLYVTSARQSLSSDVLVNAPLSGKLFEFKVEFTGAPEFSVG